MSILKPLSLENWNLFVNNRSGAECLKCFFCILNTFETCFLLIKVTKKEELNDMEEVKIKKWYIPQMETMKNVILMYRNMYDLTQYITLQVSDEVIVHGKKMQTSCEDGKQVK